MRLRISTPLILAVLLVAALRINFAPEAQAQALTPGATPLPNNWADRVRGLVLAPARTTEDVAIISTGTFTYVVRAGDTPWSLAVDFGRNIESLACSTTPTAKDPYDFQPGELLTIPALNTICHEVNNAETLEKIASLYNVSVESIVEITWNDFKRLPTAISAGRHVLVYQRENIEQPVISLPRNNLPRWDASLLPFDPANPPDGVHVSPDGYFWQGIWPYGDGNFEWPVRGGRISQPYLQNKHRAIDIAVPTGTQVKAADNGTVVVAGWNTQGYGYRVVIDHNNDYLTLYAHLSNFYVKPGDVVEKGQVIGAVGSTGNSTGPHLHFELRDFGRLRDPIKFLPTH